MRRKPFASLNGLLRRYYLIFIILANLFTTIPAAAKAAGTEPIDLAGKTSRNARLLLYEPDR